MRVPYEKQVILHELGMPIDRDYSYLTYQDAFDWFEDRGVYLNQLWFYNPELYIQLFIEWRQGDFREDLPINFEHNDRSIRYPAILDKMIEVYKEHFQK